MRYDAIVIGAGVSGLAAGIRLAQFDRRVAILERHYVWGGLNSFYGKDGYTFDVGLHALTNYVPAGTRNAPLTRALKQLRLRHADLALGEHGHSEILFPGRRLAFSNAPELLQSEVARAFPHAADRFRALWQEIEASPWDAPGGPPTSARAMLAERLGDPDLSEMLLLPVCYYGSPTEDDIEWCQFKILFRSIFVEGLARPEGGVRRLMNLLVKRYRSLGGEIRTRAGVAEVRVEGGAARGVVLEDGTELEADLVFSSAGWPETAALLGGDEEPRVLDQAERGRLTFIESISVLDREPIELGHGAATCFYSTRERFTYRSPDGLVDVTSGLTCAPNNYASQKPLDHGLLRLTVIANGASWCKLGDEYAETKRALADQAIAEFVDFTARERFCCGPGPGRVEGQNRADWRPHTVYQDIFTPRTIRHFTGHPDGVVYGSPVKRGDGRTGIDGLYLIGTDQGFLGIVGALNSGIMMANHHALVPA